MLAWVDLTMMLWYNIGPHWLPKYYQDYRILSCFVVRKQVTKYDWRQQPPRLSLWGCPKSGYCSSVLLAQRGPLRAVVPNRLCATDRFNVRQYFHGPAFKGSVSRDRDTRLDMRQEWVIDGCNRENLVKIKHRSDSDRAARYQMTHRPVPVRGPGLGDLCLREWPVTSLIGPRGPASCSVVAYGPGPSRGGSHLFKRL